MGGYSYPGTSPIKNENKLVTVGTHGGKDHYGDKGGDTSPYDIKWSKATVNLMKANAPEEVIKKAKQKDIKNFKASKGTYGA